MSVERERQALLSGVGCIATRVCNFECHPSLFCSDDTLLQLLQHHCTVSRCALDDDISAFCFRVHESCTVVYRSVDAFE